MIRLLAAVMAVVALAGCASGAAQENRDNTVQIVAAENFWGSLAAQLGGDRVHVTNIINNPGADPHDYEPTGSDARAIASADLVIVNGIGYDTWARRTVDANAFSDRRTVDVGDVVGVKAGGNPHQWYSPPSVQKVIHAISTQLRRIDAGHRAYYERREKDLETHGLATYHTLIRQIRSQYSGTPVGASESIVTPLAAALGLDLVTPRSFLNAVSAGNDPSAGDKITVDRQIDDRQIRAFIYNRQNATPDVRKLRDAARSHGIAVATVTETMEPAGVSFQDWQVGVLRGIRAALAESSRT